MEFLQPALQFLLALGRGPQIFHDALPTLQSKVWSESFEQCRETSRDLKFCVAVAPIGVHTEGGGGGGGFGSGGAHTY